MAPDARETKVHYSPSEKDGVFVVEAARGSETSGAPKLHMNREQQLPQQSMKIQNIIEQDERISLSSEKLNLNSNPAALPEPLQPAATNNEEVLVHPPPNGMCADEDVLAVDEDGAVSMSSPKLNESNAAKKAIAGSTNTGLSQSDLSVSSSTGSNQGYCYGAQEPYSIEAKGYQSSSPQKSIVETAALIEEEQDEIDAIPDYMPDTKPIIKAAIYKDEPNEIIVTSQFQIKVGMYENDRVDAETVDKEPIIEENEEENLSEKEDNSVIQQNENAISDDEKVEEVLVEEKFEQVKEDEKQIEEQQEQEQQEDEKAVDDDDEEVEEEEEAKSVVEDKDEVDAENEIQPAKEQDEEKNEIKSVEEENDEEEGEEEEDDDDDDEEQISVEQMQLGNGIHIDLKRDNANANNLPETNGNHHSEENGCTDLTDTTNDFDSLLNLPAPPTCDEIKQLNETMDSLPPPPPELAAGGPTNGES